MWLQAKLDGCACGWWFLFPEHGNGNSNESADGNKGQHSNVSDMAIDAENIGIDDWSVPDSHTMDAYCVDLLNSD